MATSTDPSPGSYTITGGEQGKQRLNLLAEIMRPTTLRLLAEAGLRDGDRCLDLGCGGGNVVLDLARIAGSDGFVTGADFDAQIAELARQDAQDAGAGNVEYHVADARVFDGGPFDLVYARFLLSHLSEPGHVLARMAQLARPRRPGRGRGHRHVRLLLSPGRSCQRPVRPAVHRGGPPRRR
jgi:ubiquinone/menaquinone biosynthesis C-methylase UbiE